MSANLEPNQTPNGEGFSIPPHPHEKDIHFTVDGEPEKIEYPKLSANNIISEYGKKDPSTHYLVQIKHREKISYKDKGGDLVTIQEHSRFQIISTGPTPVSDKKIRTGVEVFVEGLHEMGYSPVALPNKPDHIVIDYEVPVGRFAGQKVRLGFVSPSDFPVTPPSGPYISPHIHPINTGGAHPNGAVHHTQAIPFEQGASGAWQYWSRPCLDWAERKKTVTAYMSHIWRLWDSQ